MQHPIIFWGGSTLVALIILRKLILRNHANVWDNDYLEVLSFTEWMSRKEVQTTLEKKKGGWVGWLQVYIDLRMLKGEGRVEKRLGPDSNGVITEFWKKSIYGSPLGESLEISDVSEVPDAP